MLGVYGGFWEVWESNHKVKFDATNKIISINKGVTEIDFKADIYSAWKEWMTYSKVNNMWQQRAIRVVGGDSITADRSLGTTYFLVSGWRIQPWAGHSHIMLSGNVYVDEGGRPIIPDANGIDAVAMYVSNLIDNVIMNPVKTAPDEFGSGSFLEVSQEGLSVVTRWFSDKYYASYNVYIAASQDMLWSSKLGTFFTTTLNITTEFDGSTLLQGKKYYIGVKLINSNNVESANGLVSSIDFNKYNELTTDVNIVSVKGTTVDSIEDFKANTIDMSITNAKIDNVKVAIDNLHDFDPVNDIVTKVDVVNTTISNSDMVDLSNITAKVDDVDAKFTTTTDEIKADMATSNAVADIKALVDDIHSDMSALDEAYANSLYAKLLRIKDDISAVKTANTYKTYD